MFGLPRGPSAQQLGVQGLGLQGSNYSIILGLGFSVQGLGFTVQVLNNWVCAWALSVVLFEKVSGKYILSGTPAL